MAIKILSAQLANQIAAGEVVERPSSVVKELVENALDAGATQVEIQIEQGGANLILIRDNGSGISKEDLPFALARHATSKITDMDDLISILSFGFRGEALASISSVSRLTLTSNTASQSEAWQVYAEGREMNAVIKPAAHPVGTTVEVRNLFYNTPARRKFLRTEKTEFNHIDEVIRRIALVRHDVTFTLSHNGKKMRYYRAVPSQAEFTQKQTRIAQICGNPFIQSASHILWEHFDMAIEGWVMPLLSDVKESNQTVQGIQYCYVNGRIVRDKVIMHAIKQAFQTHYPGTTLSDDKLAYVIYLNLAPEQVDVNVHPAKHEVRFHQNRTVHDFIYQAVIQSLEANAQNSDLFSEQSTAQSSFTSTVADNNRSSAGANQFAGQHTTITPAMNNQTNSINEGNFAKEQSEVSDHQSKTPLLEQASNENNLISIGSEEQSQNPPLGTTSEETIANFTSSVPLEPVNYPASPEYSTKASEPEPKEVYQQLFPKRDKPFSLSPLSGTESAGKTHKPFQHQNQDRPMNRAEKALYQQLITPAQPVNQERGGRGTVTLDAQAQTFGKALHVLNQTHLLAVKSNELGQEVLSLICLYEASVELKAIQLNHVMNHNVSQALLVPMTLRLKEAEWIEFMKFQEVMTKMQIAHSVNTKQKTVEIQTVPAPLRHGDIAKYLTKLLCFWIDNAKQLTDVIGDSIYFLAKVLVEELKGSKNPTWTLAEAITLISELERMAPKPISTYGAPLVKEISVPDA